MKPKILASAMSRNSRGRLSERNRLGVFAGAEAIIYKKGNNIIKDRIKKSYRIPEIDNKIRKSRTKSETKLLQKAGQIILTPTPLNLLISKGGSERSELLGGGKRASASQSFQIIMPFIKGKKLSEHLDNFPLKKQKQILNQIGQDVAKLHNSDIIHGDLTTSNMILVDDLPAHLCSQISKNFINKKFQEDKLVNSSIKTAEKVKDYVNNKKISEQSEPNLRDGRAISRGKTSNPVTSEVASEENILGRTKIYFIDFGLGFISKKIEDKAVDIHLLKQALEAKHFKNWEILFKEFEKGYSKSKDYKEVVERLKKVEVRGRYKG